MGIRKSAKAVIVQEDKLLAIKNPQTVRKYIIDYIEGKELPVYLGDESPLRRR
ncbi:hypothetical protein NC797_16905 [Aquibacillus sp. 3ASR75-11]|uniref:Uncharacterized protein n=1 Tax=Terrihalobacillus insolitus TaxID=2950438 RepID=A0A9X3WWP3_9BACI|nr:hypothetical protein [Terrihalobacillus insolitus]MDC3426178.1 hypothetical protein [Terrihalobacillus insolitus]